MNVIFVSRILSPQNSYISQIKTSVPPVITAAIANSNLLDKENTTEGLYVIECKLDKNIAATEIEKYLRANVNINYQKTLCNDGIIYFKW